MGAGARVFYIADGMGVTTGAGCAGQRLLEHLPAPVAMRDIMSAEDGYMSDGIAEMRSLYGKPVLGPGAEAMEPAPVAVPDGTCVVRTDGKGGATVDQIGMAEYLRDLGFRYVDKRVYRFDGRFLIPADKQDLCDEMVLAARATGQRAMVNTSMKDNVVSYWTTIANPERMMGTVSPADMMDYDGWLIPFENGIYNVGKAGLMPFTPDVLFKGHIHADYEPGIALDPAVDMRMRNMYLRIFGSEAVLDFFLLATGYTLYSPVLSPPAIFILLGGGETGKSAILNVLEALLGPDRAANMSPSKLSTQFGLARLKGMAANLCDESGIRSRFSLVDSDLLKAISAGRPWDVEQKFRDVEKYRNEAKLWFAANSMPDLGDTSSGMMRRVYIFPCLIKQRASDRLYDAMTTREALAWLAYHSLYAFIMFKWGGTEKFAAPKEMEDMKIEFCLQDSISEYLYSLCETLDNDTLREWLDGRVISDLYDDYKNFTMECGRSLPVMRNTFRSRLCTEYRLVTKRRTFRDGVKVTSLMVFEKMITPPIEKLCRRIEDEEKDGDGDGGAPDGDAEDVISEGGDTTPEGRE